MVVFRATRTRREICTFLSACTHHDGALKVAPSREEAVKRCDHGTEALDAWGPLLADGTDVCSSAHADLATLREGMGPTWEDADLEILLTCLQPGLSLPGAEQADWGAANPAGGQQ